MAYIELLEIPLGIARDVAAEDERSHQAVTLRFLLNARDRESLEALCAARRSMLIEERSLPLLDAPALEDAIFSATEIRWEIPASHRTQCLEKLEALVERANVRRQSGAAPALRPFREQPTP